MGALSLTTWDVSIAIYTQCKRWSLLSVVCVHFVHHSAHHYVWDARKTDENGV